jgi:peptidyl-prolyl cis-trans isomerase SurA
MKLLSLILILTAGAAISATAEMRVIDGIQSVVANNIIVRSEVEDFCLPATETLRRQYAAEPELLNRKFLETFEDGLTNLVERQLILHAFETGGYKLPDSLVDQEIQSRIHDQYGDRITFMKTLQARGLTVEQFRKQERERFIEAAMRNQFLPRQIFVSPYKIENYYLAHPDEFQVEEQIKLRMIVLTKTAPDDTNALQLAREIQSQIKGGAAFAEMATTYSQGSQQRQGGDWGWVQRSVLRKELADIAFKLPTGTVSDLVDTPDTCYLMLVEDKHAAHVRPLTEVADEIGNILRLKQQAKVQREWIEGLKQKTFIRYF